MTRSVAQKMGIKEKSRSFIVNPDNNAIDDIELPELVYVDKFEGDFDYIHFFVKNQTEFIYGFPKLKQRLKTTGMLWVSWPKGGKLGTDLNI